eukprot:TRINITY_DN5634_c0_g2_i1.p1 TRINITY_DN5634_c0_g2~~TRINITY_DN5634_c0_g2_i1.p1  ORF type:complete len:996 (+),score=278.15 TRINITY_DN5634_c0_g2_i1:360-3347(+)
MENGSLQTILKKFGKFPETLTAVYVMQVLGGLQYLHEQGVIHRDIKAANVLTTKEGTVKLADFGVATIAKAQRKSMDAANPSSAHEVLGSPYWMAPEIIQMEGAQPSSDIWSLGCVVIELMTGKPPYFDMPQMSAMFKIAESDDPPPFPESISADLTDFLTLCFERDPAKRPSATQLLDHKWIVSARERKGKGSSKTGKRTDSMSSTTSGDTSGDDSDVKIETPRKRKAKRKDSYALSGSGEVPGSSNTPRNSIRNILRTHSSSSVGLLSMLEDVNKMEDELEELRQQVVLEVRNNHALETDVKRLDKKIELLIKNRITLEEVIASPKASMKLEAPGGEDSNLKRDPKLLEGYSRLFYLLQVDPKYLANLIFFQLPGIDKFIETIILTLYGYAYSPREEFLLLQLFEAAIKREITNLSTLHAFSDEAQVLIKMIMAYNSRVQEQDFLRQLLGKLMDNVLEKKDLNLEYDPKKIYKALLAQAETQTGEKTTMKPDATEEEMRAHPQVAEICQKRVAQLLEIVDTFLNAIVGSVANFPYGLRWIMKELKSALANKFSNASAAELLGIVGYISYYRFINPAIVAPDDFEMAEGQVSLAQRVNLIGISKILQLIANQKHMEGNESTMIEVKAINKYIKSVESKMHKFLEQLTESVEDPSEHLQIDKKYLEYTLTQRPVIYISLNEMILTHKSMKERLDKLAPDAKDPVRQVIMSLPEPPATDDNDPKLANEISLTLLPFTSVDDPDKEASKASLQNEKLYQKTKKMICEIIVDSAQEALSQIDLLDLLTGPEVSGNTKLTVTVGKILENLETLDHVGLVSKSNHYKKILEDIQSDLKQKAMLRGKIAKEVAVLKTTLTRLKEKKQLLTQQLNDYHSYVKACLEQAVTRKGGDKKKKKKVRRECKYTCAQLVKKGVIAEIDVGTSQQNNITFHITESSEVAGEYQCKVSYAGIPVETVVIQLDDLLEKQDNGVYFLDLASNRTKIRINLLIHLLNKMVLS